MTWLQKIKNSFSSSHSPATRLQRWVAIDVETSGLDTANDQLLAIACVAMQVDWQTKTLSLLPGDSLEITVKPREAVHNKNNILIHGIGLQRQTSGVDTSIALERMLAFIDTAPLFAFHAWFDKQIIHRHLQLCNLPVLRNTWVDIEHVCAAAHGHVQAHSLDDWMAYLEIQCPARHSAISDAWAECEVLQRIWPAIKPNCHQFKDFQKLASHARWMRQASA